MPEYDWSWLTLRNPVSAGTHFAGFLWSLFSLAILWMLCRRDRPKQLSIGCFGVSMSILYLASATYHALCLPPERLEFYRLLDHSAIYGLIAGTYTPVFAVLLRGRQRWGFLLVMWTLALVGIFAKWVLPSTYYPATVSLYLGMGAVGFLPIAELTRMVGPRGFFWGLLGVFFHVSGAIMDLIGWPVLYPGVFGSHELLHVHVLAGTAAHYVMIVRYIVPFHHYQPIPIVLPRLRSAA